MTMTQFHHRPGAFRSSHTQIIPARTHVARTRTGRIDYMITLSDRLAFRERVHIGDRVKLIDDSYVGADSGSFRRKSGIITELYEHIVVVQTAAYRISYSYDELMLHDHVYLEEDDDYRVRRIWSE